MLDNCWKQYGFIFEVSLFHRISLTFLFLTNNQGRLKIFLGGYFMPMDNIVGFVFSPKKF